MQSRINSSDRLLRQSTIFARNRNDDRVAPLPETWPPLSSSMRIGDDLAKCVPRVRVLSAPWLTSSRSARLVIFHPQS